MIAPTLPTADTPWRTVLDDAHEVLRTLPDGAVDVTITDPPYDQATHANAATMAGGSVGSIDIDFAPLASLAFVQELLRVTKRWVLCFGTLEDIGRYRDAAGGRWNEGGCFVRAGVWHRPDGTPQLTGDRPAQGAEAIIILHSRVSGVALRWNGGGQRAHWTVPRVRIPASAGDRFHPTQKPLVLMNELVRLFSEAGELVFDPFAGSMTTGAAALRHQRRFLGVERDRTYFRAGTDRLARVAAAWTPTAASQPATTP